MKAERVIVILDVGKTNKKILLFDEDYNVVYQESVRLKETVDEDGYPCEDVFLLTEWVKKSFLKILADERFDVQAVNFSAYGASLVYVDETLRPLLPIYNYLKPYPGSIQHSFYEKYDGEEDFSKRTASPVLGSLNSGMQLYRLKIDRPEMFLKVKYALHLPQYLSSILTKRAYSEITSIGCHTNLWDYKLSSYHRWVQENVISKLAPIVPCDHSSPVSYHDKIIQAGVGLHDSSAALNPYLLSFNYPFILLSTGTWCISLNPFNHQPLTSEELRQDCLCYMAFDGKPVKASRLFAGFEHEQACKRLSRFFDKPIEYFTKLQYTDEIAKRISPYMQQLREGTYDTTRVEFEKRDLSEFIDCNDAYCQLLIGLVANQLEATNRIQSRPSARRIFIDGGFSKNDIYMKLIAAAFPEINIYAASVAEASSLGAALAIHKNWNTKSIPSDLIQLKLYSDAPKDLV